jgi:hypothetical protein
MNSAFLASRLGGEHLCSGRFFLFSPVRSALAPVELAGGLFSEARDGRRER